MNNSQKHQQTREKLPWYLLLLFLLSALAWGASGNNFQSAFLPGLILFSTAAVRMYLVLRVENYHQARHVWITGAISVILGIIFIIARHLTPAFLEMAALVWIAISLFFLFRSGRSISILAFWVMLSILASAALVQDYQRWFIPITFGIAACELIATSFLLTIVKWRPKHSALLTALQKSEKSESSIQHFAHITQSEPILWKAGNVWLSVIILILLGIHLERMGFSGNLGILPPLIALIGDLIISLILAFLVILPLRILLAGILGIYEDRLISVINKNATHSASAKFAQFLYVRHILLRMRLTEARFSLPLMLRQGLVTGLPIVAVLTGIVPLLGTNWFFDTEQWATIGRDEWAALNADKWRMEMVAAANSNENRSLLVNIPEMGDGDFSFVVVGDPGQGGLSQRELAKQIVQISDQEDIKFVLVSSDVIYPNGEMNDYEAKFWSPFSGLSKPIIAIPGNHDWYDGIDSFSATFFTKDAARAAITSRTSEDRADTLIETAEKLRKTYGLKTQLQTAPYFKIETSEFVLICLDTGVVAGIDEMQMKWFRHTLEEARGKTIMALLGHPIFAWNRNTTLSQPGLVPILDLLRKNNVSIVMAGDVHDFEFYLDTSNADHPMYHFVNGGGGAYISLDRALGSPSKPITEQWAYYPTRDAIYEKLNAEIPSLILPIWWMAKMWEGKVWSGDRFSTALDQDKSPFLNSFVVVQVESSRDQVRVIPYGVDGRLKWSDFALSDDQKALPPGNAEWSIPMLNYK